MRIYTEEGARKLAESQFDLAEKSREKMVSILTGRVGGALVGEPVRRHLLSKMDAASKILIRILLADDPVGYLGYIAKCLDSARIVALCLEELEDDDEVR